MEEMEQMNTEELLKQVNTAIRTVLIGGQSYQIGSRKLTRADLSLLRRINRIRLEFKGVFVDKCAVGHTWY